jgi:Helix-turn-helix domain
MPKVAPADALTRGVVFVLDPTPGQERLLWSYVGAARRAHNWALDQVTENLSTRAAERAAGVPEDRLTASLSWSAYSLNKLWNEAKGTEAPWWREVSMHAFRSGVRNAAAGLANFSDSKIGARAGRRMGFPRFKSRNRSSLQSASSRSTTSSRGSAHPTRDPPHAAPVLP